MLNKTEIEQNKEGLTLTGRANSLGCKVDRLWYYGRLNNIDIQTNYKYTRVSIEEFNVIASNIIKNKEAIENNVDKLSLTKMASQYNTTLKFFKNTCNRNNIDIMTNYKRKVKY